MQFPILTTEFYTNIPILPSETFDNILTRKTHCITIRSDM